MPAQAPGKFILFGEHAVVHGYPAVALAVDLRLRAEFEPGGEPRLDGDAEADAVSENPYLAEAFEQFGAGGDLRIASEVPRAVGLGSSAALCAALAGAIFEPGSEPELAHRAFALERGAQGSGSPIDTSTAAHGSGVVVRPERADDHLWSFDEGDVTWHIHHVDVPDLSFVVGDTGVPRSTSDLVARVAFLATMDPGAKQALRSIGEITRRGIDALAEGDPRRIGVLMDENQKMLERIGVNTEELQSLVEAAREHAYGAKLTGAGGGGSMVALTGEPEACADAIADAGGDPYVVETTREGASW